MRSHRFACLVSRQCTLLLSDEARRLAEKHRSGPSMTLVSLSVGSSRLKDEAFGKAHSHTFHEANSPTRFSPGDEEDLDIYDPACIFRQLFDNPIFLTDIYPRQTRSNSDAFRPP